VRQAAAILAVALALAGPGRAVAAEESGEALADRGILLYRGGDLAGAVPLLRRALQRQPDNVDAAHYLGLALVRQGKRQQGRTLLKQAAARDNRPPKVRARLLLDLGLAYLVDGNAPWAVRMLNRARALDPDNPRIQHYLGVALLRMGAAKEATEPLQRAANVAHPRQEASRLQLGLALYRAKQWSASREVLDDVRIGHYRPLASQLLRASFEGQGTRASWVSAEVASGYVLNTNPLWFPDFSDPISGLSIAGNLTLRPWVTERNLLWGNVALARVFFFGSFSEPQQVFTPSDGSLTEVLASASYARRFPGQGRSWELRLGYSFGLVFLDGPPPLADDSHIFLESHSGRVALQRLWDSGHRLQLRYRLNRDSFVSAARNNWGNELQAEHSFGFFADRMRLLTWGFFRYEAADSAAYNAVVPGLGLGYSWLAPLDLVLGLRASYEYRYHHDWESLDPATGATFRRHDHILIVTAELGRAILWGFRARAVYQRFQRFSTVDLFDTPQDQFTLSLSWSYH
jgi:Tfp pilus assembly protein PilF